MNYFGAYKWTDVLEEYVPRTLIGLKHIKKERENEQRKYDDANRGNK